MFSCIYVTFILWSIMFTITSFLEFYIRRIAKETADRLNQIHKRQQQQQQLCGGDRGGRSCGVSCKYSVRCGERFPLKTPGIRVWLWKTSDTELPADTAGAAGVSSIALNTSH